jgi:PPK2 family polyphosphate:nucleotide phosphotransferase
MGLPGFHLDTMRRLPRSMPMNATTAAAPHLSRKQTRRILDRYRVSSGKGFRLKNFDPEDTAGHLLTKQQAEIMLAEDVHRLAALQEKLYAQNEWSMLCVLQAMDAAGKDGTIKHVMSGVNPQGVRVTSFKAPGHEELAHGFLWRANRVLPPRGHVGIFNRSHYEEVLVVRVHRALLERQNLPKELVDKRLWDQRLEAIADFERYLTRQGTVVLKFFLNLSKQEQKRRFSNGWRKRTSTGSSVPATWPSARSGTTISVSTRKRSPLPPRRTRRGSWCRRTTSGSRG